MYASIAKLIHSLFREETSHQVVLHGLAQVCYAVLPADSRRLLQSPRCQIGQACHAQTCLVSHRWLRRCTRSVSTTRMHAMPNFIGRLNKLYFVAKSSCGLDATHGRPLFGQELSKRHVQNAGWRIIEHRLVARRVNDRQSIGHAPSQTLVSERTLLLKTI